MENQARQEVWLRGPVTGITPLLQPAAHALLQAMEEIQSYTTNLDDELIWKEVAGCASVAFHLQHLVGILDRLFTYAADGQLSEEQLQYLSREGKHEPSSTLDMLLRNLQRQMDKSIDQLKHTEPLSLTETRYVGRKKIPSTVGGLLFHAAEHMQRHTGQILVTARVILDEQQDKHLRNVGNS